MLIIDYPQVTNNASRRDIRKENEIYVGYTILEFLAAV